MLLVFCSVAGIVFGVNVVVFLPFGIFQASSVGTGRRPKVDWRSPSGLLDNLWFPWDCPDYLEHVLWTGLHLLLLENILTGSVRYISGELGEKLMYMYFITMLFVALYFSFFLVKWGVIWWQRWVYNLEQKQCKINAQEGLINIKLNLKQNMSRFLYSSLILQYCYWYYYFYTYFGFIFALWVNICINKVSETRA